MNYYITLYQQWLATTTVPSPTSPAVIKNRDLYNYLTNLFNIVKGMYGDSKNVYHKTTDPHNNVTDIPVGLSFIYSAFWGSNPEESIKAAIEYNSSRGGEVLETDNILDLAGRISKIKNANILIEPLEVNSIKFEKEADEGHAFNPVNINITGGAIYKEVTQNGTYEAEPGTTGYSQVLVNVPFSGSSSGGYGGSGGSSGGGSAKEGEDEVSVNVSDVTFTKNDTYDAANDGLDGYGTVTVSVSDFEVDPDKRFTVKFVIGDHEETVEDVEPYANVEYPGEIPEHEETGDCWYFKGWNPEPFQVIHDMVCYGEYGIVQPPANEILDGESGGRLYPVVTFGRSWVTNSWEDICKDGGINTFNLGSMKPLFIDGFGPIIMQKVPAGSQGATSVFIAKTPFETRHFGAGNMMRIDENKPFCWDNMNLKTCLNTTFFNTLPEILRKHIVPMSKTLLKPDGNGVIFGSSKDKIWLPDAREVNLIDLGMKLPLANGTTFDYTSDQMVGSIDSVAYNNAFPWFQSSEVYPNFKEDQHKSILRRIDEIKVSNANQIEKARTLVAHESTQEFIETITQGAPVYGTGWDLRSATDKIRMEREYGLSNTPHYDYYDLLYKNPVQIPVFYDWNGVNIDPMYQFSSTMSPILLLRDSGGKVSAERGCTMILYRPSTFMAQSYNIIDYTTESDDSDFGSHPNISFGFGIVSKEVN